MSDNNTQSATCRDSEVLAAHEELRQALAAKNDAKTKQTVAENVTRKANERVKMAHREIERIAYGHAKWKPPPGSWAEVFANADSVEVTQEDVNGIAEAFAVKAPIVTP